jgi:hypothetical protein
VAAAGSLKPSSVRFCEVRPEKIRQTGMKKNLSWTVWFVAIGLVCWLGYLASQKPKVWCDREWAGVALLKGGYRSWTMRFCD